MSKHEKRTLALPHPKSDSLAKYDVDVTVPAYQQKEFCAAVTTVMNITRDNEMSDTESQLMRLALKRHSVKPLELYYAVLDAYEDQYTPSSGLEWKHVWKHVKKRREETYQTPDDMVDHFENENQNHVTNNENNH